MHFQNADLSNTDLSNTTLMEPISEVRTSRVSSGELPQWRRQRLDGEQLLWCPPSGFTPAAGCPDEDYSGGADQ